MNTLIQNLDPNIANALGWTIIHSFWQASLIALLMSLVHRFAKNKTSNFKYGVSVASMILVLVVSAITFTGYYSASHASNEVVGAFELSQSSLSLDIENSFVNSIQLFFAQNLDYINFIWSIGVLFFMLRFAFSYGYTKYLRSTAIYENSSDLRKTLNRLKGNFLVKSTIEIAESSKIAVPLVVGHIKPLILFPIGIINMLTTEEVDAIITHELAHIKRYDYLTNILLTLVEILFYFHPAVWWISANVKAERENCCDDFALSNDIDKVIYAKALVKLEEIKSYRSPALAMPFLSNKHQLLNRIKRIMNMPQAKNDIKEKSIATVLLLSMVLLFSSQANSKSPQTNPLETNEVKTEEVKDLGDVTRELEASISELEAEKNTFIEERNETSSIDEKNLKTDIKLLRERLYEELEESRHIEMMSDTVPGVKNRSSVTIKTEDDGRSVEIKKENGEVTMLKIDGKEIPKSDYHKYEKELDSNDFIYEYNDRNIFKHFNDGTFSNSFGMIFDGNNWREFGGNLNQLLEEDVFEELKELEGMRFDFKELEGLEGLKELERLHELKGFEGMESLENLHEMLEELDIDVDPSFRGMRYNFGDLDELRNFRFFNDSDDDIRIYRDDESRHHRGTVVDKIGSMLNKDGLLKEYKSNKVEITGKHLKINGEKMPKALFEKYKNIYQESTGAPLTKGSKMVFDVEGKPSKRKVKTF